MPGRSGCTAALFVAVRLAFALLATPATAAGQSPAASILDVPYLPQTEALCGGAAAAMLFRFWGQRHADVQQFAPLVDRRTGGIADGDLVRAIQDRGWSAERIDGSLARLQQEIAAGRPPMLLLEDRPQRYHFVVVVAADANGAVLHDPAWGPSRRLAADELERAWTPSGHWMLRVTPLHVPDPVAVPQPAAADAIRVESTPECAEGLDHVLDDAGRVSLDATANRLEALRGACPRDARVLAELAAARFAQRQWSAAETLAARAVGIDPSDSYAVDLLASSRFMLNDAPGALRAWNLIGRPHLDSVRITGLRRTRYALVALALGLTTNAPLTPQQFTLARRRIDAMPDHATTRVALRPDRDGFAVVDIAVVERATIPRTPIMWGATAAQAAIERELSLVVPGGTGQGETWSASWGWWRNRPRAALEFAAPRTAWPRGVWRVRAAWESQAYGPDAAAALREERLQAQLSIGDWLTDNLRADLFVGADSWRRPGQRRDRMLRLGAAVERRFAGDRVATTVAVNRWAGLDGSPSFHTAGVGASFRSRRDPTGVVLVGRAGATVASAEAPLALWGGAGEGRGRGPLLRAHRLLREGRINGTVFGRRVAHLTLEGQRWLPRPALLRVGAAVFVDAAVAGRRATFSSGRPFQVDAGVGLRLRVPGIGGTFRVDYARGLRDGARSVLATWQAVD